MLAAKQLTRRTKHLYVQARKIDMNIDQEVTSIQDAFAVHR